MKLFTKLLMVCLIILVSCIFAFSQVKIDGDIHSPEGMFEPLLSKTESSPTSGLLNSLSGTKAMFDLLFDFPVRDGSTYGVETDGQYFYVSRWNADSFYKYSLTGTLLDSFSITGVTNIRDLAYDGQYFYGSNASATIYKMDFNAHTLIGTIACPGSTAVRHIAYDPLSDAFWYGDWSTDFRLISKSGTVINTIPATTHLQTSIFGSAYDDFTPGGPYLWLYTQASTNLNGLTQVKIATGQPTALSLDVTTVVTGIDGINNGAGGLCIAGNVVPNKVALIGVSQNAKLWGLELAETGCDASVTAINNLYSACDLGSENIEISVTNMGTNPISDLPVAYQVNNGSVVMDTITGPITSGQTVSFTFAVPADLSALGVYDITVYTLSPTDIDTSNDTLTHTVTNLAPKTVPYTLDFDQANDFLGTSIIDNNNDGKTWHVNTIFGNTNPYCIRYSWSFLVADDWFITSCIDLEAAKTYNLQYYYKAENANSPENLKVAIGNDNTPAALTTVIDNHTGIVNTSYVASSVSFTVPVTGSYYLGWHCYSAIDMHNIYVDDISISGTTGVEENKHAISVMIMPNPASDQFTILTSENESLVTVTSALGAVVYHARVNNNMINVNAASFRSGIYFVKVETEKGSSVQKIVITK